MKEENKVIKFPKKFKQMEILLFPGTKDEAFWAYSIEREKNEHPFNREWNEAREQRARDSIMEDLEIFND